MTKKSPLAGHHQTIVARFSSGETMAFIGRSYGVTRMAIKRVVDDNVTDEERARRHPNRQRVGRPVALKRPHQRRVAHALPDIETP